MINGLVPQALMKFECQNQATNGHFLLLWAKSRFVRLYPIIDIKENPFAWITNIFFFSPQVKLYMVKLKTDKKIIFYFENGYLPLRVSFHVGIEFPCYFQYKQHLNRYIRIENWSIASVCVIQYRMFVSLDSFHFRWLDLQHFNLMESVAFVTNHETQWVNYVYYNRFRMFVW